MKSTKILGEDAAAKDEPSQKYDLDQVKRVLQQFQKLAELSYDDKKVSGEGFGHGGYYTLGWAGATLHALVSDIKSGRTLVIPLSEEQQRRYEVLAHTLGAESVNTLVLRSLEKLYDETFG
jgi:hypothetical protein